MKFGQLFADVVREHVRSRLIYLYLVLAVLVVAALLLTVWLQKDRAEAEWFTRMAAQSSAEHRTRLLSLAANPPADLQPAGQLPPTMSLLRPLDNRLSEQRLFQTRLGAAGIPLWVLEMPHAATGCIIIAAAGGIFEEDASNYGATELCMQLINDWTEEHRDDYPLVLNPVGWTPGGMLFKATFLADRLAAATSSLVSLISEPQVNPSMRQYFSMGDTLSKRQHDSESKVSDMALEHLLPGHRYSIPTIGTLESHMRMREYDSEQFMYRLFAPGRLRIVVTGPYQAEEVVTLLEKCLEPLVNCPTSAPPRSQAVVPQPGTYRRGVESAKRAFVATGFFIGGSGNSVGLPWNQQLFSMLFINWNLRLRDQGLIYGGNLWGPIPNGDSSAYVAIFSCAAKKADVLAVEMARWLQEFPGNITDEALRGAVTSMSSNSERMMQFPEEAAQQIARRYLLNGMPPMTPEEEAQTWRTMSMEDIRGMFRAPNGNQATVIAEVLPKSAAP